MRRYGRRLQTEVVEELVEGGEVRFRVDSSQQPRVRPRCLTQRPQLLDLLVAHATNDRPQPRLTDMTGAGAEILSVWTSLRYLQKRQLP